MAVAKNNDETYRALGDRLEVENPGRTIAGMWTRNYVSTGRLERSLAHDLDACLGAAEELYVAYSYQTPIAWYSDLTGWQMPSQKHSPTTTSHQSGLIHELPTDEVGLPDWDGEYLYPKFLSGGVTV